MGGMWLAGGFGCLGLGSAAEWLNDRLMYRLCIGYVSVMSRL
jgi:hypothetical protein